MSKMEDKIEAMIVGLFCDMQNEGVDEIDHINPMTGEIEIVMSNGESYSIKIERN